MADVFRRALQVVLAASLYATYARSAAGAPSTTATTPEDVAKARELFARAQADESRGDYLSALEKFERVAETKDTASVRFHLGYCSEKLGRLASALHNYNLALREAERESNIDVKSAAIKATDALAPRVPHLTLLCPPDIPSCAVTLDGRPLSTAELSVFILVDPGNHHVSARAAGQKAFETDVTLHEHETRTVQLELAPAIASAAAPRASASPAAAAAPTPAPASPSSTPSVPTGAWLAAGGAVALAGFGVGSFFGAGSAQDSLKATCSTHTSCEDAKTSVRAWDTVALGSFISAGALAVVATVLFLKPRNGPAAGRRWPEQAALVLGTGRFALGGSF